MKPSELLESFVKPCDLGDKQIGEIQSVENANVPLHKVLKSGLHKSENSSQGRHDSNVAQNEAVEHEMSMAQSQLFVYVFVPGADCWEMEQLETVSSGHVSVPVSQLSCLAQSLTEVTISKTLSL
jgi:hypothetical protein